MADDVIKAEAAALRSVRAAVTHYAQQIRDALGEARRDADALVKRAEEAARRRANDLNRALADVQQAQAKLSACRDEQQAAALRGEVAARQRYAAERRQLLGFAQQAVKAANDVRSNLVKTVQALDGSVAEHESVSTTALGEIEAKLKEIGYESLGARVGQAVRPTLAKGAIAVEVVLATARFGSIAGDVAQGHLVTADRFTTQSQVAEHRLEQEQEYYADHKDLEDGS